MVAPVVLPDLTLAMLLEFLEICVAGIARRSRFILLTAMNALSLKVRVAQGFTKNRLSDSFVFTVHS